MTFLNILESESVIVCLFFFSVSFSAVYARSEFSASKKFCFHPDNKY